MITYVLRRLLVVLPTLAGVTVVSFILLVLAPPPSGTGVDALERSRALFADLPLVVSPRPRDLEVEVDDALATAELGGVTPDLSTRGAVLVPLLVPRLGALSTTGQAWALAALAPVATRFVDPAERVDGQPTVVAWEDAWETHRLDFRQGHVRRLVHRVERGESGHAREELADLGTFALSDLVDALDDAKRDARARARLVASLREIAPHAGAARFSPSDERARDAWLEWWFVHRTDYVVFGPVERAVAVVRETRYGRWVERLLRLRLGTSVRDGRPVLEKLRARAGVTLGLAALAAVLAFVGAVPLGLFGAVRKGTIPERITSTLSFLLYSLPVVWVATLVLGTFTGPAGTSFFPAGGLSDPSLAHASLVVRMLDVARHLVLPVACLAYPSLVTLSRHQRSAALEVVRSDYVRTARAKGLPASLVLRRHVLRIAFLPVLTLAGLQVTLLLGTSVIVEQIFGIPGVGAETVAAVAAGDVPWLLAITVMAAITSTLAVLLSDVLYALVDPRTRRPRAGEGQ